MKILKKSFEEFVTEYEKNSSGEKVILTGTLYQDLRKYFIRMVYRNVFYALPKDYAYDITTDICYSLKSERIELFKNDDSFICLQGYFKIYENGYIDESIFNDDDIVMCKFVLPMRELIKQMQQYYIDHNLSNEKERSKPCQQTVTSAN